MRPVSKAPSEASVTRSLMEWVTTGLWSNSKLTFTSAGTAVWNFGKFCFTRSTTASVEASARLVTGM